MIGALRAFWRVLRRRRADDRRRDALALQARTPVVKFAGYDESKARAIFDREQRQAAQRRAKSLKAQRSMEMSANVVPIRRRS